MTQIEINELTKEYDTGDSAIVAVEDLDLSIEDGEFIVFVGPSGCGKSTTLRCIAGLESVTDGEIRFDDEVVNDLRPRDRDVAMVFQNYALYPHMTVKQNMSFGLKLSSQLSSGEIDSRVTDAAEMMGIDDLLGKRPGELSGGQQQRVALGRSIVREPGVFLMDEPLSNLDAKLRAGMRTEIQELQNELDVTTIYVTHDQTEAMAMGDRIAVLNGGVLQQAAVPEELYRNPVNEFVADFIGSPSINLFDVTVEGTRLAGPGGFTYRLSGFDLGERSHARMGVRPEDLAIDERGDDLTVTVVEKMGNENFIYGELGGQEVVARTDSSIRPEPDDEVGLAFEEEAVYFFEPDSGRAIKTKTDEIDSMRTQI
ncbi:ABC transporter ATP-binding protein [Halococcus hamelinensis]|uniref:ABC-type D-xylose/L-arabinose transporter n=1 Tax=Halococcus hamelinensis 100A6 TaxID=1132509 RepID=M0LX52_9EURY|nr:ABC transporter ATP-binding protein [Halococcus hamelinensis]EMA38016.1 ABC transporter [Halococcus hamelinensis 100A6]